jgi:general secretion pathway protein E
MGVEPFKLDASLVASMAQRLVRLLCPNCRIPTPVTPDQAALFEKYGLSAPDTIWRPDGCPDCRREGYKGRTALAEFATQGMPLPPSDTLMGQGLALVISGQTSVQEVLGLGEA